MIETKSFGFFKDFDLAATRIDLFQYTFFLFDEGEFGVYLLGKPRKSLV